MIVAIRKGSFWSCLLVALTLFASRCVPGGESCGECYDRCGESIDCDATCGGACGN